MKPLREEKRKTSISLYDKGLSLREIASKCDVK